MNLHRYRTPPLRAAVGFAAVVTVGAAVGMDLLAGERPLHTATLGLVALVIGLARIRLAGNYSGYFSAVSGAIVAQPALHAAMKLLSPVPDETAGLAHHAAETSISFTHVLVAAVIVAAVTGAQQLFLLLAAAVPIGWLLLLVRVPTPRTPPVPVASAAATPVKRWSLIRVTPLRGPPAFVRPVSAG